MSIELIRCAGEKLGEALPAQCASCPFRDGNDAEWGVVVNKLRKAHGLKPVKPGSHIIKHARKSVRLETAMKGSDQFACHGSAYDENMQIRPAKEHRQCPGAVEFMKQWQHLTKSRSTT